MTQRRRGSLDADIGDLAEWPTSGFVRVGVAVILQDSRGRVLVGKRRGSHGAGMLALPGGHLELGETFATCAKREIIEETGLYVGKPKHIFTTNDPMPAEQKHYVTIFMLANVPHNAEPKNCEPHKCEGWVWCTWAELRATPDAELFVPLRNLLSSPDFVAPNSMRARQAWQLAAGGGMLALAAGLAFSLGRSRAPQ